MEESKHILRASFSAPSKIILSGEHSVVYGHPAIAFAVGEYRDKTDEEEKQNEKIYRTELSIVVTNRNSESDNLLTFTSELFSTSFDDYNNLLNCETKEELSINLAKIFVNSAKRSGFDESNEKIRLAMEKYCFSINVNFGTPVGAGLGSSATFNVLICGAVFTIFNCLFSEDISTYLNSFSIDKDYLAIVNELGYYGEKLIHGNPSGIDNFITTMGGMVKYSKSSDGKITTETDVHIPSDFSCTDIIYSGNSRSTKTCLNQMVTLKNNFPNVFKTLIESISCVTTEFETLLKSEDYSQEKLVFLVDVNHKLLQSLKLSTPTIDELSNIASQNNVGLKITGAGCGGCLLVFYSQSSNVDEFRKSVSSMHDKGVKLINIDMNSRGFYLDAWSI